MKIFQVQDGFCFWDATSVVSTLEASKQLFSSELHFVEAPDYVFEGWSFDEDLEGNDRFIKPIAPEGWRYDDRDGSFKPEGYEEPKTTDEKIEELRSEVHEQINFMNLTTTILDGIDGI